MLRQFSRAAGICNSNIRGDDDVRRARVYGGIVVIEDERGAVVNLAKRDSGRGSVVFENFDARISFGRALQPDERDVVFGWPNSGGIIGGFRIRNVTAIGKQSYRRSSVDEL